VMQETSSVTVLSEETLLSSTVPAGTRGTKSK